MTLENFSQLTEYELINLYDIQSSHIREVVLHTVGNTEMSLSNNSVGLIAGSPQPIHAGSGQQHSAETVNEDEEVRFVC